MIFIITVSAFNKADCDYSPPTIVLLSNIYLSVENDRGDPIFYATKVAAFRLPTGMG